MFAIFTVFLIAIFMLFPAQNQVLSLSGNSYALANRVHFGVDLLPLTVAVAVLSSVVHSVP